MLVAAVGLTAGPRGATRLLISTFKGKYGGPLPLPCFYRFHFSARLVFISQYNSIMGMPVTMLACCFLPLATR